MATSSRTQRAVAEINFGEGAGTPFKIGNRTVHQFWHLYSSHCRHLLLAPQRRPDTGRTAWTWRESVEKRPVTAVELTEVRRRLAEASRSLGGGPEVDRDDDDPATLEAQVRASVTEMIAQLIAQRDAVLMGFVCRTEAGLMVHSWGASAAAEPQYPDTQNGEISGLLMVGDDRPIGVGVALETPQGGGLARVKSDSNGHFRFPNIAPGNYRVRVLDRSDFAANGVEVTMEHESITGLELRSVSGEAPVPSNSAAALTSDEPPPWFKRKVTFIVVLLLLLLIGGCVWRASRPTKMQTTSQIRSAEWQAAQGQLATADAKGLSADEPKVGADGAWTSLSKSSQGSRPTTLPSVKTPAGIAKRDANPPSPPAESEALAVPRPTDAKPHPTESTGKVKPENAAAARSKSKVPNGTATDNSADEKARDGEAVSTSALANKPKPTENELAKPSSSPEAKKRTAVIATADAPGDEEASEPTPSSAGGPAANSSAATSAAASRAKADKLVKAKVATGNPAGAAADAPDAGADEGGANTPADSSALPSAANQAKAAVGKKAKMASGDSTTADETPAAAESAPSRPAAEASPEKPTDETGATKSPLPTTAKKKPRSSPPATTAKSDEPTEQTTAENSPTQSSAPASAMKTPKRSAASAGISSSSASSSTEDAGVSAADAEGDEDAASPAAASQKTSASERKKTSPKSAGVSAPSPVGGDGNAPDEDRAPSTVESSSGAVLAAVEAAAPLVRFGQVKASVWKPRLLQDQILPTRPMTAAEDDAVEAMRAKLLQSRRAQIPPAFQSPHTQRGLVIELPTSADSRAGSPEWRDDTGAIPEGATVSGTRAELTWGGNEASRGREYILRTPVGHELARVRLESSGALVLQATPAAKFRYWVGVDGSSSEAVTSGPTVGPRRLDWRLLSGESLPVSWSQDDRWREGRGRRLEIPLDVTSKRVGHYGIALLDQSSGWALVCDVAIQ